MRLALGVEYDGGAFRGYQFQTNAPSVQDTLQQALSGVANESISLLAAGRTDAGVHATAQVVSFQTNAERPDDAWVRGTNTLTSDRVKVRWSARVADDFHPRFGATARRYMYLFRESRTPSPLLDPYAVRSRALNDAAMHSTARLLQGEQDFSAFRASGCQSATPYRCVHRVSVRRVARFVVLDITANAFLLHMVRNIAGSLWQVGLGLQDHNWFSTVLASRQRRLAAATAPPQGLYLVDVRYPGQSFPPGELPPVLQALGTLPDF